MKVIYIISFPPKYEYSYWVEPEFYFTNKKGEKIGIWRIDRGHVFAKDVKQYFPEIEYEVWRPDYRAEKEYIHVFEDGVVHRSFPAQKVIFRVGLKPTEYYTSKELLTKLSLLIDEHKETKDLLCHVPLNFSYMGYVILKKFGNKIPFLHTSHLNANLLFNVDMNVFNPLKFLNRLFIKRTLRKHVSRLKEIAATPESVELFKQKTKSTVYQWNSLNFNFEWAKGKLSKEAAREKLGLPKDSFIIFSSSRLVPEKQIDKLIQVLGSLKQYSFLCIISGAGETGYEKYLTKLCEDLGISNKIQFVGFLSDLLLDYYCASDLYISTSKSEGAILSLIKALAVEIPVVSTNTGIGSYLLHQKHGGVIIDKDDTKGWKDKLEKILQGEKVKILDAKELEEEYGLQNNIHQLTTYYQKSISNFWKNKK